MYVSPFAILAMILGLNADTNWAGIGIGFVVGCIASVFFVALRQALRVATPAVKDVFREPVPQATQPKQKPVRGRWVDVTGRELGPDAQIEAPRSVAVVVSEKGVRK